MNRAHNFALLIAVLVLLSAACAGAQIPLRMDTSNPSSCPVQMSARQTGVGDLVKAAPGQAQANQGPAQKIDLTIAGGKSVDVVAATVRVHGLTPATRAVPAAESVHGPEGTTRTLHLTFREEAAGARAAALLLRGFTSVSSIDLISLTYADGSVWAQGERACRVTPDPMMLISSR